MLLADPGEARGCSTNTFIIYSLIDMFSDPLVQISLRRRHAQNVKNGDSSQKQNILTFFRDSKS